MNIQVRKQLLAPNRNIRTFIYHQILNLWVLGSLILATVILILESYYRTKLHEGSTIFVGGPVTFCSFGLVALLAAFEWMFWKEANYKANKAGEYQLNLNDEFIEYGITGHWVKRYYWHLIAKHNDLKSDFELWAGKDYVIIPKSWLTSAEIVALREFLATRSNR